MTTIQDRIIKDYNEKFGRNSGRLTFYNEQKYYWNNEFYNDVEQFLIQSIKLVEEETRKETLEELENKLYDNWHIVNGSWKDMYKFLQSITNKEIKK